MSKLHRQPGIGAPAISVEQVLAMATANAAAPTGFAGDIGVLEPGRRADLLLIRMDRLEDPYLEPDTPPVEVVLGRAKTQDVAAVIVDGEVLLQDGAHQRFNRADVARELREQLARPLEPETLATRRMASRLSPYVERFYTSLSPAGEVPSAGAPTRVQQPHLIASGWTAALRIPRDYGHRVELARNRIVEETMVLEIESARGAMTGARYVESLKDNREVWLDGVKVTDVANHPAMTGMVHELARIYDLHTRMNTGIR